MKRLLLLLAFAGALVAQPTQGTVSITVGGVTKTYTFTLEPLTVITALTCDQTVLQPGASSLCTFTLNQAPPAPITVPVLLPSSLTGPSSVPVTSGSSGTFTVTYPAPAPPTQVVPAALNPSASNVVYGVQRGDLLSCGERSSCIYSVAHYQPSVAVTMAGM